MRDYVEGVTSATWKYATGGEVAADVARLVEGPGIRDPLRDERVQRALEFGTGFLIHHPSADLRIGARLLGRIDVNAAKQDRLRIIKERIVERRLRRDPGFVTGEPVS